MVGAGGSWGGGPSRWNIHPSGICHSSKSPGGVNGEKEKKKKHTENDRVKQTGERAGQRGEKKKREREPGKGRKKNTSQKAE